METINSLSRWVRNLNVGEMKCAFLPKGSNENSIRCTASQFNRNDGSKKGAAVHITFFWKYKAICAVCVSYDEFLEHHKDRKYVNTWRKTAKEFFYNELAKSEKEEAAHEH